MTTVERPIVSIRIAGRLTADLVDSQLTSNRTVRDCWSQPLLIDLTAASFIDIAALVHILALLRDRYSSSVDTRIAIPKSRKVRDFFRAWNFPEVASQVSGRPFEDLVSPDSLRYFGELPQYYNGNEASRTEDPAAAAYERLLQQRFFGFHAYTFQSPAQMTIAVEREWRRWRQPLLLSVLDRYLTAPGSEIARVVIYELLANAIQHPFADQCVIGSRIVGLNPTSQLANPKRQLSISIWDDGTSMISTIRDCLRDSLPVRLYSPDGYAEADVFNVDGFGWAQQKSQYATSDTPHQDSPDEEILLSCLFPGVSRKAAHHVPDIPKPVADLSDSQHGLGLYSLYRSVVETFGGTLAIRTGSSFLKLRKAGGGSGRANAYDVELKRSDGRPLFGNLLTVRIPLVTSE